MTARRVCIAAGVLLAVVAITAIGAGIDYLIMTAAEQIDSALAAP